MDTVNDHSLKTPHPFRGQTGSTDVKEGGMGLHGYGFGLGRGSKQINHYEKEDSISTALAWVERQNRSIIIMRKRTPFLLLWPG